MVSWLSGKPDHYNIKNMRKEPKSQKNTRLKTYDYSTNGYYYITNNTHFSKSLIHGQVKEIIKEQLLDLQNRFIGVSVYYYSLMPTHVHVIIVLQDAEKTIPQIWGVFKSITTVFARKNGLQEMHLWQLNYFEHVIRNEYALQKIVKYIENNPHKENIPLDEIYGDRLPDIEA